MVLTAVICAILSFACVRATEASVRYASLLRVGEHVLYDAEAERELWEALDSRPQAFDEITIFSQNNHSVRTLDRHRKTARRAESFLRAAERRGLAAGVNVLATVGFCEDEYDPATDTVPMAYYGPGSCIRGQFCRSAPETLDYVRELYSIYARIRPAFIYIDDDVSSLRCRCPRCLSASLGVTNMAEVCKLTDSEDPAVRRKAREDWIAYGETAADRICAAAREGVDAVDPGIGLGFMTYTLGWSGHDSGRWARTLAGKGPLSNVRWRPGGGNWTDSSYGDLVSKLLGVEFQDFGLPEGLTKVQGEIENFPYNMLRKSPSYMGFEALALLAAGCTGVAWNLAGFNMTDPFELAPYYDAVANVRPAGERIVAVCGRTPCEGIAYPWTIRSSIALDRRKFNDERFRIPLPVSFAAIGLPIASVPARACVTLLNKAMALELSDAGLKRILSDAAFLDAGALEVVNARGFGDYTGFRPGATAARDTITRDLAHPLNLEGRRARDLRVSHHQRTDPYVMIEKTAAKAEFMSEAVNQHLDPVGGYASGIFENEAGGRIAVEAVVPFDWCESHARSVHLKRLFRWLSRDTIGAYVASFHRAMVFQRSKALFVANLATEPLNGCEIASAIGGKRQLTAFGGGRILGERTLEPVRTDGAYAIYRLPEIPVNGEALLGAPLSD